MLTIRRAFGAASLSALLGVVMAPAALKAQPGGAAAPKTIALGLVAETHQKEIQAHFRNFIRYVAANISGSRSPVEGRVVLASTQSQLADRLLAKHVDFYMESPHPTYMINDVYAAGKLLLRRWKGGMADYHAMIFASKAGDVTRLEDLQGKVIAFEDSESTSGYFLPKLFLTNRGFKLARKSQSGGRVASGEIGYIFAQSQARVLDLVLTGKVAAGAFSNDDYRLLDADKKGAVAVLAATASLPRHLVSVRRDLPPSIVKRLEQVLLGMHQDRQGRTILEKADGTTKFDSLPGGELAMRQRLLETYYSARNK